MIFRVLAQARGWALSRYISEENLTEEFKSHSTHNSNDNRLVQSTHLTNMSSSISTCNASNRYLHILWFSLLLDRQAGGYKATINNPNRSEETKEAAREKLENLENCKFLYILLFIYIMIHLSHAAEEYEAANSGEVEMTGKNEGNVLGGYKATLKSMFFHPRCR